MHHCACASVSGGASSGVGGSCGMRKSCSTGSLAQLAQHHHLQHPALPSRLRPNVPRAGSFASLNGAVQPSTSDFGARAGQQDQLRQTQSVSAASDATNLHKAAVKASPFASLTRVFLIGQPQNLVRGLAGRKFRAVGPVSLLLFLFGMILAIMTAVRSVLVRRVKSCKTCMGYGITRCRLCNGEGTVAWAGKSNHQEMCPLCMTKRYVTCQDCGGYYHRPLFAHIQQNTRGVPEFLGAA